MGIEMSVLANFELPYPGHTGNKSVRHGGGRHYLTKEALAYRVQVASAVNPTGRLKPLPGPLHCDWLIAPPDLKARDIDNLLKVVKDALTKAGVWADDSNRVLPAGSWLWTDPVPGGRIFLTLSKVGV